MFGTAYILRTDFIKILHFTVTFMFELYFDAKVIENYLCQVKF
jgi:hypothetical protein